MLTLVLLSGGLDSAVLAAHYSIGIGAEWLLAFDEGERPAGLQPDPADLVQRERVGGLVQVGLGVRGREPVRAASNTESIG